jgi:hypothetical protein
MKTSTLLKSALSIALVSALIFSCKKKDDTAPEDTNNTTTTGGTTGGTTGSTPTPTTPANGLSANQYKIGTTVYTVTTPGWSANGYAGFNTASTSNQFKAIFSSKGPVSGTYSVVSVPSALSAVGANEIGIYVLENYLQKTITPGTGTVNVTHNNGKVTIMVNNVTMGSTTFNANYVIGDDTRYIYADNNSLDPDYTMAESIGEYTNVHKTRIKTYGSQTSDSEAWNFVFYYGATGLNNGTYTSMGQPSLIQNIPAGNVFVIADKGALQYKSTSTSGSITVNNNKISFNNFVITTSTSQTVALRGEYQF